MRAHPEFGGSLYDAHSDGSGTCYASRLRPLLNFRPGYQASWFSAAGSFLWQFNADTHVIDWLEASGFAYDVVTDEDLHAEGHELLANYRTVMTGSHPEYWTEQMRAALVTYTRQGGRLAYPGNGFYWRIAYHRELPGVIELRRAEGGIRAWVSEPGEYYHSFTGEYGGLWERQGQPPHRVVGIGCIAQGFDVSSYYRRQPGSFDPRAAFIFEGIAPDELIGDFGLTGGGAAGLEIDCFYADSARRRMLCCWPRRKIIRTSISWCRKGSRSRTLSSTRPATLQFALTWCFSNVRKAAPYSPWGQSPGPAASRIMTTRTTFRRSHVMF